MHIANGLCQEKGQNQERLLRLAGMYRGLSRKELARALGRDVSNLFPANGNPKLDYLARLADVLDWPVGVVVEAIRGSSPGGDDGAAPCDRAADGAAFAAIDARARAAHAAGDYARMGELAVRMTDVAANTDERGLAALREAGAWDGLGRYVAQIEALRRALREPVASIDLRLLLEANLANAHYNLWYLFEARSMATALIGRFEGAPPSNRAQRATRAFAHYVLGNADRRLLASPAPDQLERAMAAKTSLGTAQRLYEELADEFDHEPWRGIASTCDAGRLETRVELGEVTAGDALELVNEKIAAVDRGDRLCGDALESCGWWCIFGCNIATRHLSGHDRPRHIGRFCGTGTGIANQLGNWAMRERLFTLELEKREQLTELAGMPVDWMIGDREVKVLVGTMGRFPRFRETGWRILDTATLIGA